MSTPPPDKPLCECGAAAGPTGLCDDCFFGRTGPSLSTPPDKPQGAETTLQIAREYSRIEDMSHDGKLSLWLQQDGDVIVSITGYTHFGEQSSAQVEFCCPGAGGGRSPHTRKALRELIIAMERDNQERPIL